MTSQFAYAVHEQRHQLLEQLVSKLLHVQPEDENYSLALDFCLQKAYYHSFPDINPRETEEVYADLVARLEGDSQLTKAAALSALTKKVLALSLQSPAGVQDLNHNLLQLLASLSNQPLSSSLELTPDVLELLYTPAAAVGDGAQPKQQQQQHPGGSNRFQRLLAGAAAAGKRAAPGRGAGSVASSDEYDPYGDDSSLSDWEDSDGQQHQQQQHEQQWDQEQASSEAPLDSQQQLEEQEQQLGLIPVAVPSAGQATAAQTRHLGAARLPQGWLLPTPQQPVAKLAALRPQRHSMQAGQPLRQQLCMSELFLCHQVLQVLQGLPAQGFTTVDPREAVQRSSGRKPSLRTTSSWGQSISTSGTITNSSSSDGTTCLNSEQYFVVDARVSTPQLLPAALRALLADAAAAGTHARQLRALVQQLAFGSSVGNGVQVTPCLRAFGVALQQQLDSLGLLLAELQEQLQATHDARPGSSGSSRQQQQDCERGLLMQFVVREARPVMRRLRLLHGAVFGILQQLSGSPAAVSAGLIDGLTAAVEAAAMQSGPQGVAGAAALLHLLLSSCVPLSRALAQWLWCASDGTQQGGGEQQQQRQLGGASVCSQDFFILRKASSDMPAVHPSFWHTAYAFSSSSSAGGEGASGTGSAQPAQAAAGACCPAVLAPFAHSIMTAGKSMRLLDYMDQQDLKQCSMLLGSGTRPNLAGSVPAAQEIRSSWSTAAAQQPRQADGTTASTLQRQPSTPRRRRISSAGGRIGAGSAVAAGGSGILAGRLLSRPASATGFRPARAAAAGGGAAADALKASDATCSSSSRRKWSAAREQSVPAGGAVAAAATSAERAVAAGGSSFSQRLKLQLAAAAAVAGRQAQEELPSEFIGGVCYLLQQEQQLQAQADDQVQQHKLYLQQCSGAGAPDASSSSSSAGTMLLQRLQAVASSVAKPHGPAAGTAAAASCEHIRAQGDASGVPSLRDALCAARQARLAKLAVLDGAEHHTAAQHLTPPQQPLEVQAGPPEPSAAAAGDDGTAADTACSPDAPAGCGSSSSDCGSGGGSSAQQPEGSSPVKQSPTAAEVSEALAPHTPPKGPAPAADATDRADEAFEAAAAAPDLVPRLTVWRDQLEARLSTVGQQLQRMAPREPQQQQHQQQQHPPSGDDTQQVPDSSSKQQGLGKGELRRQGEAGSSKSWLLQTANAQCPAHFTGSLAALWPLKPIVGLRAAARAASSNDSGGTAAWLGGAAWPGSDLAWLLHDPPAHLPCVQQLMWSAFVQPVRARVELVDRQLMSSLMGEWGMLQQLQGLANAFLISSPSMVEWVDSLFAAVEAAKHSTAKRGRGAGEGATPPAGARTLARTGAGPLGAAAGSSAAWGCESPGSVASPSGRGGAGGGGGGGGGGVLPVGVEDLELMSLEALLQECISCAGPDEVLPDCDALLLKYNSEGLEDLRAWQEDRHRAEHAAAAAAQLPGAASSSAALAASAGLMLCSREWVGLELQHTGSWQLSLVYTDEQLRCFSQVWRLMLQLRWVRRRVGAQAVAHRGSASVNDLAARDSLEAAQVAAAAAAAASSGRSGLRSATGFGPGSPVVGGSSFSQQQGRAGAAGGMAAAAAGGGAAEWLSGKEELLLLQEMWHFFRCWHSYVMNGVRVKAWEQLEQVLLSARSLDQVHSATRAFLDTMCSFANFHQPTAGGSRPSTTAAAPAAAANNVRALTSKWLDCLMDDALAAAAAAGRLHAARQKLGELQGVRDRAAGTHAWWVELGKARELLSGAGSRWRKDLGVLLGSWTTLKSYNMSHAFDELVDVLDMNGYFSKYAGR